MDYIFNVRAQFVNGTDLKTQFSKIKKYIEGETIQVHAVLNSESWNKILSDIRKIRTEINKNIGQITFNSEGLDTVRSEMQQVANTTSSVTQQTQQAKQAVQQLSDAYAQLSKQDVFDALNSKSGGLPKELQVFKSTEEITLKSIDQSDRLKVLGDIKKAYEETFGNTNVEVRVRFKAN